MNFLKNETKKNRIEMFTLQTNGTISTDLISPFIYLTKLIEHSTELIFF